jgi:hypothetical protein
VIKILERKYVLILSVLMIICLMGSASAANTTNVKHSNSQSITNQHFKLISNHYNSTSSTTKKVNSTKNQIVPGHGCCSVLLHVKKGYDMYSFRRDSVYTATLYIKKTNWYGKDALEEYKTTNGYFFHTVISKNGWIFGAGGPDIPSLNKQLMELAGKTSASGHITSGTIKSATSILKQMGMGHFLIKAPDDNVGAVTYNGGSLKTALFKMSNGQYVSVPNSPSCYRTGYISTANPVASSIKLAMTDRWGVNRRNIMTYQVQNVKDLVNYSTNVKIWASDSRGTPDSIVFNGKEISKYSIPRAPNKKLIGQMVFKDSTTIPSRISGEVLNGLNYGYKSTFSADGKNTSINFNSYKSDLHYQISSTKTKGAQGYGKYTTVMVTGKNDQGSTIHRVVYYFNNMFINSKLTLSNSQGSVFYTSESKKVGSHIFETLKGKISKTLSFTGHVQTAMDYKNGQQLYKNSTVNINYQNNGTTFSSTSAKLKFVYQSFNGNYSLRNKVSNSTTSYSNSTYTKTTLMNFNYKRSTKGKLVGLQITGTANGVEDSLTKFNSTIQVQTKQDMTDLYSEGYHSGNYSEHTTSLSTTSNKIAPLYESVIL